MDTPSGETKHDSCSKSEAEQSLGDSEAAYNLLVESLRVSEARYRELFENANDLVYTVDFEGTFTSVNRTTEETTGFSRDELIGADISVLVPPEYVNKVRDMIRHKVTTRGRTTLIMVRRLFRVATRRFRVEPGPASRIWSARKRSLF